jgi:tRNA pseudouridine38/39 synthase
MRPAPLRLGISRAGTRRIVTRTKTPLSIPSPRPHNPTSNRTMSTQPDYSTYTHSSLLARVTELEAQLRSLNTQHSTPTSSSPTLARKKPRKAPKPFDPSKYTTRHIALKFAYLGSNYNGFEYHANNSTPLPTIEEELWKALRKTRLIFPEFNGKSEDEVCWDGTEYSKCGRTDRGVSAFGQVVGVRVRSARPKEKPQKVEEEGGLGGDGDIDTADGLNGAEDQNTEGSETKPWDPITDELPYIQLLNRVLPPDIRILAWCPNPPRDFSARFNCKERRYRYFFTNPAYATAPNSEEGWLDIEAMQLAAKKYEGLHDFRNLCKVDASKQITNFERRIFHAGIHAVNPKKGGMNEGGMNGVAGVHSTESFLSPELYYFEVRGSAFLWHQVRHLVAVLFLVGQGYEEPSIVDKLLDVTTCPSKPVYEMASDVPLVLWDCTFPEPEKVAQADHLANGDCPTPSHEDALDWVYVGDEGGRETAKRCVPVVDDGKYGRNGIMDELWALWRKRKIDEVLASSLMEVVEAQGRKPAAALNGVDESPQVDADERSDRVFDGSERPRTVGTYIPLMQRERMEEPSVVNARYAARKGLVPKQADDADADE